MKANLIFKDRAQAEKFAITWTRYSKTGHNISAGNENVKVTVFDLKDSDKIWIDRYVRELNNNEG